MNTSAENQNLGAVVTTEKLYTQIEVDYLLDKKGNSLVYQLKEEEIQTKIKLNRLNDKAVASLIKKSNRILISISSHALPFDIFPDTINVEEGRITIIKRHGLFSEVHSVDIGDISNIFINTSFIRSQLVIISETFKENEIRMHNLRNKEALYVRRIIEGLRVFGKNNIDTSNFTKEELLVKLEELSTRRVVT